MDQEVMSRRREVLDNSLYLYLASLYTVYTFFHTASQSSPDSTDPCIPRKSIVFRIILATVGRDDTTESYIGQKIVAL